MIKLIIFDLDGVLVETKDLHYTALNQALIAHGVEEISYKDHISKYDGKSTRTKLATALELGLNVEADVRLFKNELWLGHNQPDYLVPKYFKQYGDRIWWHAKDIPTICYLLEKGVNCFFHNTDECTITSRGILWIYPEKTLVNNCVAVIKGETSYTKEQLLQCHGICSDSLKDIQLMIKGNREK